jgi:hypothetical protein
VIKHLTALRFPDDTPIEHVRTQPTTAFTRSLKDSSRESFRIRSTDANNCNAAFANGGGHGSNRVFLVHKAKQS